MGHHIIPYPQVEKTWNSLGFSGAEQREAAGSSRFGRAGALSYEPRLGLGSSDKQREA